MIPVATPDDKSIVPVLTLTPARLRALDPLHRTVFYLLQEIGKAELVVE